MKVSVLQQRMIRVLFGVLILLFGTAISLGDWDPGDSCKMHYPQLPDPVGWDICLNHAVIADDFQCAETGPITDVHFWVSWQNDYPRWDLIESIDMNFYADGGGKPGTVLKAYHILPTDPCFHYRWYGSGAQGWHCPEAPFTVPYDHVNFYQINLVPLAEPWFIQQQGEHYWLGFVIHMLPDGDQDPQNDPQIGWKTTDPLYHWGEFSKWSIGGPWLNVMPQDMVRDQAFVITNDAQGGTLDYGDAPDQPYPTLNANDGARHKIVQGMFIGAVIDGEPDGQPTIPADGDDLNPPAGPDDEDGVAFVAPPMIGQMASFQITVSIPGKLDAWIDFDQNGVWTMGLPEQIAISVPLMAGANTINFSVPASALPGQTYARFRYSTAGGLAPTGLAMDGEVEDYTVTIREVTGACCYPDGSCMDTTNVSCSSGGGAWQGAGTTCATTTCAQNLDFGDAPDSSSTPIYPTLMAHDGARHVAGGPWLGDPSDTPDTELDGQATPSADGDDLMDGNDDEDGLQVPRMTEGMGGVISLIVNGGPGGTGGGVVQIWIDWNQDGTWTHPAEQVFVGYRAAGIYPIPVTPPMGSAGQTFLRARISTQGGLLPTGLAANGEVEDHPVIIAMGERLDFGDAFDSLQIPGYPTLLANNGARHTIGGPWFGDAADAPDPEINGQPTVNADGDDTSSLDDEDGVVIPVLYQGVPAYVMLTVAGGGGVVEYWIDFNQNKVWELSERLYSVFLSDGSYNMYISVPASALTGQTYARFRISTAGVGVPTGAAADGEVEDYLVTIEDGPKADLGDAPDSTNSSGSIMTAYPGVQADFPTVFNGPMPVGPKHLGALSDVCLGLSVSPEDEADTGMDADISNNINPVSDANDLDGSDDGLGLPVRMPHCKWTTVNYTVNVPSSGLGLYYVNIWCDWNRDGDWNDLLSTECKDVPEWAVRNQMLSGMSPGLRTLNSLPFVSWHPSGGSKALWMRITISEQPWMQAWGDGGCGSMNGYAVGETEDYLVLPDTSCTECADLNCDKAVNISDLAIMASQWLSTCP